MRINIFRSHKIIILVFLINFIFSCSTNNNTSTVVPIAPTSLTAIVISTTHVNISWTDNATNEMGFKIQRKASSGNFTDVGSTAMDVTSFSDIGVTPNTTYTYRVYAYNSAGNSLQYSNEVSITTTIIPANLPSIAIGTQIWSSRNLDVANYKNGDPIPQVTDPTQWANLTSGAWCHYNNGTALGSIYGRLYNWYAVNDPRGLAPAGWHVPTDAEGSTLAISLGGETIAGGSMKEVGTTHWLSPNTAATNNSGYTGLAGSCRMNDGQFGDLLKNGYWWSASDYNSDVAWLRSLSYVGGNLTKSVSKKTWGFSVRVVRD